MKLHDLTFNLEALIVALEGDQEVIERLEEMGMGCGRSVRVLRKMPMGGPYVVQAGTIFIALRENEAACVTVSAGRAG
jgi:Fe2+ transport system protein FeoA